MVGKDILTWLAKECVIFRLLPGGMGHLKDRTEEHVQAIVDHWLEHGELSTVHRGKKDGGAEPQQLYAAA
jgi:hypothetical protein